MKKQDKITAKAILFNASIKHRLAYKEATQ